MDKLEKLQSRRWVYGDIVQSSRDKEELEELLKTYNNDVSKVIFHLDERVRRRGTQTLIPPAFYGRDGLLYQPPSFEIEYGDNTVLEPFKEMAIR